MTNETSWTRDNPFAPHSPATPETFVDRERETDMIFGHIKAVQRGNIAINGPLGIGKTSLLHYVGDPSVAAEYGVEPPRYALVYVDVHSVTPFSADRFWRRVVRLLARSGSVGLDDATRRLLQTDDIDVTDVEEFLDAAADRDTVLVLLLDEFEWTLQADSPAAEAESRNFLAQMASLARRAPRVMSIILSTEPPLAEATQVIESWRGSPFPTVFTSVTLRSLDREAAYELINMALDDDDDEMPDDERSLLYSFSRGQPAALQAAAFSLFQGRRRGLRGDALWESARRASIAALEALEPPVAPRRPAATDTGAVGGEAGRPGAQSTSGTPLIIGGGSAGGAGAGTVAADGSGLVIDARSGDVLVNGRRVETLTALEYSLLKLLYDSPGRLCSKDEIIRHVWGDEFLGEVDASRVEKLVSRLRRKIEAVPGRPQYIRTVRGRGYRFVP
jgi:hypothetical protein